MRLKCQLSPLMNVKKVNKMRKFKKEFTEEFVGRVLIILTLLVLVLMFAAIFI